MELLPVDTANKKVSIRNSKGEYEESYDALVLSPGAKALRPPIPGIDNKHILTLRNVPDADALRDLSLHYPEGKAVVIGGGFVGIEVAEKVAQGAVVIDIRSKALHEAGHISGAINIPTEKLRSNIQQLDKDKTYIIACVTGLNGYFMERILRQKGYNARNLIGGHTYYKTVK